MKNTKFRKPLRVSVLAYGTYATYAEREESGANVKHPTSGHDLGRPMTRLIRVAEPNRRVHWNVGRGIGSDGCAYRGGQIFTSKRAAVAAYEAA